MGCGCQQGLCAGHVPPAFPPYSPPPFLPSAGPPYKCPECGIWWTGPEHRCRPTIQVATTNFPDTDHPEVTA